MDHDIARSTILSHAIVHTSASAMIVLDEKGRVVLFNEAAQRRFGRNDQAVLDQPLEQIFAEDHTFELHQARACLQGKIEPEKWQGRTINVTGIHGDGTFFPLQLSLSTCNFQGQTLVSALAVDHSEPSRAEWATQQSTLLNTLLANLPHFIFWKDRDLVYQGCSDSFARVAGISKAAAIVGKTDYDLAWTEDQADWYRRCDQKVMDSREPWLNIEESQTVSDGSTLTLLTSKVPLLDEAGQVVGIMGIYADISENKAIELNQQDLILQLEAANQELTDFAYMVSHDLKAPLRGIKTVLQWFINDCADEIPAQGREYMDILDNRVDRMRSLIQGILTYSRIGRLREELASIDLNVCVEEVIEQLSVPDHVMVSIETELPFIWFDQTRIVQVFQNLIDNAIQYADKSPAFVRIGCVDEGDHWTFSVADNGIGISPEQFERIFMIFQTLQPRDEHESAGVGLTVVKKIVELYAGSIWVESTPGEGSTFFFTISKALGPDSTNTIIHSQGQSIS